MKLLGMLLGSACSLALGACANLEPFADRATAFNEEVATTQNRTLMLNVMRAVYRYPMHFTELSTLSGTETIMGSAMLAVPFSHIYGSTDSRTGTLGGSVSQSPTFNIAVLETQEFYRGMLAQVSFDQLYAYLTEGMPREEILMLAIGAFRYRPSVNEALVTVSNNFHELPLDMLPNAANQGRAACSQHVYESECFMDILRALEKRGLTLEATQDKKNLGGPLGPEGLTNLRGLQGLDQQSLQVNPFDLADCDAGNSACPDAKSFDTAIQERLKKGETLYRIQKVNKGTQFCFDTAPNRPDGSAMPAPDPATNTYLTDTLAHRIEYSPISPSLICAARRVPAKKKSRTELVELAKHSKAFGASTDNQPEKPASSRGPDGTIAPEPIAAFTFRIADQPSNGPTRGSDSPAFDAMIRSTEGIIYYLGEIARCELDTQHGDTKKGKAPCPTPKVFIEDFNKEATLFAVSQRSSLTPAPSKFLVTVPFEGANYDVKMDASGDDRSGQVLRVVTQLIALNRAAKDFPVPAVVPLLSR